MTETIDVLVTPLVTADARSRVVHATLTLDRPLPASHIRLSDGERRIDHPLPPLNPGAQRVRLTVPQESQTIRWMVELVVEREDRLVRGEFVVPPARSWVIHVVPHSHLDIGYTDRQATILALHRQILDTLPELCEATAGWDEARFAWSIEAAYPLMDWVRSRPQRAHGRLADWMKRGHIEITGAAMTSHTDVASVEGLSRGLYLARDLGDYFGVPVVSAMQTDVEGYTWRLASLFAHAGIRYFSAAINHNRSGASVIDPIALGLPWLFHWRGPDSHGPLVAYASGYWHRLPAAIDALEDYVGGFVADWEARGYPYRNVLLRSAGDNKLPDLDACAAVRAWNDRYATPRLRISTCAQAFAAIEGEPHVAFPELRADWPEWWADGVGAGAREMGLNRTAHRLLSAAEKLHTFALLQDEDASTTYPTEDMTRAWAGIGLFDEHTWGAAWPWLDALRGPASGHQQWAWKAAQAQSAYEESGRLAEAGAHRLATLAAPAADALLTLMVINSASWPRTDTVTVTLFPSLPRGAALVAENLATGAVGPVQILDDDEEDARVDGVQSARVGVFVAGDVPAHGYACFAVRASRASEGLEADPDPRVEVRELTMRTPFHHISLDPATGSVVSLVDVATGLQWAAPDAEFGLNAFVREQYNVAPGFNHLSHFVDGAHPAIVLARNGARAITIRPGAAGPVMWSLVVEAMVPGIERVRQEIRAYAELPRIDMVNSVTKPTTLDKEAGYFAFPFPADESRVSYSIPGAARPRDERTIPGSCTAWFAVEDWIAVEREGGTLLWIAEEAPIVEFGQTTVPYAPFPRYQPSPAHYHHRRTPTDTGDVVPFPGGCLLFSYAFNNVWDTNFPAAQGGTLPFRYSVVTGDAMLTAQDAPQVAATCREPLLAVPVTGTRDATRPSMGYTGQFLRIDRPDVRVLTVKQGRQPGTVAVRFVITATVGGSVRLTFPGVIVDDAYLATLIEERVASCAVRDGEIVIPVEPHGLHTVVLRGHRSIP